MFITRERLTGDDTDRHLDFYEWVSGAIQQVATGPSGGNDISRERIYCPPVVYDDYCGSLVFVSENGARIVFETTEKLVAADTDETIDVYQRAGGVTTLLSPARPDREPIYGERDSDVFFVDASLDASIAYLESEEQPPADDTNIGRTAYACTRRPPVRWCRAWAGATRARRRPPAAPFPAAGTARALTPTSAPPPKSAARLRLAARPRALRLARGKTRLARRGRGIALRLTATRVLLVGAERIVAGRRDGATCRAPTRRLRRAPRCTRTVAAARPLRLRTASGRAVLRLGRRWLNAGRRRIALERRSTRTGARGTPVRLTLRLKR